MVLVKVNYQVTSDHGPLVFPVNRSLLQLFPGANNVDSDTWNEMKKLPRTQELLRDRVLHSPDYTAIIAPPVTKVNENTYDLIDASDKSDKSGKIPSIVSPVKESEEEAKPARVASKKQSDDDSGKTGDKKNQDEKKVAVSKFQSGVSSPNS